MERTGCRCYHYSIRKAFNTKGREGKSCMKRKHFKENIAGYLFILPTFIGFTVFMAYPLFYSIFLSFWDWNMFEGLDGSEFVGAANYIDVFSR